MNSTWPKTIVKGFVQHFVTAADSTTLVLEGEEHNHDADSWIEFRRMGPHFVELSNNYYRIRITIDLAIMELIDRATNVYTSDDIVGQLLPYFDKVTTDLGCFTVISNVKIIPWGRIAKDSHVKQTTMEATFQLEVSNV